MLRVLDLFSGIGGFSLGLERAGMTTVAHCEQDPYCQRVLAKHWPEVAIHNDVLDLRGISLSGLISGREAERTNGKPQQAALRPDWVIVENVAHTWRKWVPELRSELYRLGYASVPFRMRASNVGAHHERARIFVVANADSELLRELSGWWHGSGREMATQLAQSQDFAPERLGTDDGLSNWVDRRRALGNAIVPQLAEIIGKGILELETKE